MGWWSRWLSLGSFGIYQSNASLPAQEDEIARLESGALLLQDGARAADMVQLRVRLATEDPGQTPRVSLLGVCTNATQMAGEERVIDRALELPAYACLNRDPALGKHLADAATLAMLMNRWGSDVLPEEIAHLCCDTATHRYDRLPNLCAVAGAWGFSCYLAYAGIGALRDEIYAGRAVAARVHYRTPTPGQGEAQTGGEAQGPLPPVLPHAPRESTGHLVAVCGFVRRDGREYVLLHDPLAETDDAVRREVSLSLFAAMYTGQALLLRRAGRRTGWERPRRQLAQLDAANGQLRLTGGGQALIPEAFAASGQSPFTFCCTLSGSVAYASAAQKTFYYPKPNDNGIIPLSPDAAGRKLTCYYISCGGQFWVGEKKVHNVPNNAEENTAPPS